MRQLPALRVLGLAALIVGAVGCSNEPEAGTLPPPPKPLDKQTIDSMPAEARGPASAAQERGSAMARQYAERYGRR